MMLRVLPAVFSLAAVMALGACGGGDAETDESFLNAPGMAATPKSLPVGLVRATPAVELVTNSNFASGTQGWRMSSLSRSALGNKDPFLVTRSVQSQDSLPASPRTVAQLCGYATQVGGTTANCNDILISTDDAPLVVPKGTVGLQVSVWAYGTYGCKGDNVGHAPLVVGLKPLDGSPNTNPYRIQAGEASLPEGVWRELSIDITDIPGVADKPRTFKLMIGFSTLRPECAAPADQNTSVLLANVSVKARLAQ